MVPADSALSVSRLGGSPVTATRDTVRDSQIRAALHADDIESSVRKRQAKAVASRDRTWDECYPRCDTVTHSHIHAPPGRRDGLTVIQGTIAH